MILRFSNRLGAVGITIVTVLATWSGLQAAWSEEVRSVEAPRIVQEDGRFSLFVEGHPFLMLGGQIHNSSAWPSEFPQVWQSMAELHANTIEAPVYWEQMEPQEGQFNFDIVDQLIEGARAHDLHVVLLWFGTWKNGNMHYVPAWIKADPKRFPHTIRPDGEPIDVLSPNGPATLEADKIAFVALMRHLKQIDGDRHTALMIQVENESGNIGSIRDNSPESNSIFEGPVPADLLAVVHKPEGNWRQVFGGDADEIFQVYHQAHYINEIAAAGKAEFSIPCYINVWLNYPAEQLPQRQLDLPGIGYPSGGAVQSRVGLWKALAPAIDAIGPDLYDAHSAFVHSVLQVYSRPDNPLLIPETGRSDDFGKYFYAALGAGAIGFAPFGVDQTGWNITGDQPWRAHSRNFELFHPMAREIARLSFEGKVKTVIEESGQATQELDLGVWQATVSFGFPQQDGRPAPGTPDAHGAALIAQIGPDEFLVTGVDASVIFHLPGKQPWSHSQIITTEQGIYEKDVWKPIRLWNGDETDRGLCFYQKPEVVHVRMGRF
jgi:hypothetical protein